MEENFDKILREKLRNFEKSPPPGTFAAIQQKLKEPVKEEKKVFTLPVFVKYGLAASFAFVLGLLAMNWFSDFNDPNISNNPVATNDNPYVETPVAEDLNEKPSLIEKIGSGLQDAGINSVESASTNLLNEIIESSAPVAKSHAKPDHTKTRPNSYWKNNEEGNYANNGDPKDGVNGIYSNDEYLSDYMNYDADGDKIVIDIKSKYAGMYKPKTDNISTYALYSIENEIEDGVEVIKVEDVNIDDIIVGKKKKKKLK